MKKLLFVLALGIFAACGNGESSDSATDSSSMMDTATMTPAPMDTAAAPMMDTTMKDSTKM